MDVNLNKLNIDKSDWTHVTFGDVAREPKENVKDLQAEGIEHVVGLEHIDSEDIHLRRSANPETSTTFTKKFAKGDVLFGRRRAYLKKAALAPFSGICSGDITVFRAKDNILPELLPFVVCNDKFFDYAVKHSAGGLSPRVKFKDLANYQFLLPPKEQQTQLAELLWAMDEVTDSNFKLLDIAEKMYRAKREFEILKKGDSNSLMYNSRLKEEVNKEIKFVKLGKLLIDIRYGTSKKGNSEMRGVPVLGIPNVVNERLSLDSLNYAVLEKNELKSCKLKYGDIVIVRTNGNPEYTGNSALYDINGGHAFASYLIKITIDEKLIDPEFLIRFLQTKRLF
jgi:type I restriction enzyme S subunit